METTTYKCEDCGWIGSEPRRFCVSSGQSSNPIRYLCPDCAKTGKYSSIKLFHIVPRDAYYEITNPKHLFEGFCLPHILNCHKGLENPMLNDNKLKYLEKHSGPDRNMVTRWYRKKDVDAFIKAVNG